MVADTLTNEETHKEPRANMPEKERDTFTAKYLVWRVFGYSDKIAYCKAEKLHSVFHSQAKQVISLKLSAAQEPKVPFWRHYF